MCTCAAWEESRCLQSRKPRSTLTGHNRAVLYGLRITRCDRLCTQLGMAPAPGSCRSIADDVDRAQCLGLLFCRTCTSADGRGAFTWILCVVCAENGPVLGVAPGKSCATKIECATQTATSSIELFNLSGLSPSKKMSAESHYFTTDHNLVSM